MTPLYILPFDHRSSLAKILLGFPYPVKTKGQALRIASLKRMIFEAICKAQKTLEHPEWLGMLVEEEFGGALLKEAQKRNMTRAVTIEKSGRPLFEFEYGKAFAQHLEKYTPTYAKVLIRYDYADTTSNAIQNPRLKKISNFCKKNKIAFMLEPLLVGKGSRFNQMKKMIVTLEALGIKPQLWKLEGLDKASEWKAIRKLTKGDLIILGRGASKQEVERWVKEAAQSGVVRGFAVGRTIFFPPLKAYVQGKITRTQAIDRIKKNFLHFVHLFEENRT